jgi:GntR family transcriptional repressor for pyruvate dehydrogenase complex
MTEKGAEVFTLADHRAIYEAIADRDPRRAHLCAAAHIERTEDWFRRNASQDAAAAALSYAAPG